MKLNHSNLTSQQAVQHLYFGQNKQQKTYFEITRKKIEQQVNHPQFITNTHQV